MGTEAFPEVQRRLRQRLVNAAEDLIREGWQTEEKEMRDFSSQLSQLLYACASARCAEEIGCYVRYQIGRTKWPPKFGERVLAQVKQVLDDTQIADPAAQVEAWRLLATYLKRAYVYQRASRSADRAAPPTRDRREEGPRPQRQDGPNQRRRP